MGLGKINRLFQRPSAFLWRLVCIVTSCCIFLAAICCRATNSRPEHGGIRKLLRDGPTLNTFPRAVWNFKLHAELLLDLCVLVVQLKIKVMERVVCIQVLFGIQAAGLVAHEVVES